MRGIFKGSAVSGCTYNYHKETKTKYTYMAFIFDLGNPLLKYAASVLGPKKSSGWNKVWNKSCWKWFKLLFFSFFS